LTRPGLKHEVMNVARGKAINLLELLKLLGEGTGRQPELKFGPTRAGDVLHSVAEVSRMESLLGLKATMPLDRGLAETLAWLQARSKA
jgi:nucleoside-diphosphate-sugar epimerase